MSITNNQTASLTQTLQQARKSRRLSQLELSLRMGVSQRHVSFVESGRARPSRELLLAWLRELDAPLAVRNAALLQAGFAPVYGKESLQDAALAPAQGAIAHLLDAHDPMPAMVMDSHWNVLQLNRGARWLALLLMPDLLSALRDTQPLNMIDALCHPQGMASHLTNLQEVGPHLLAHLRDDAQVHPELRERVDAFAARLTAALGAGALHAAPALASPVLTSRFATPHGELAFFSMFTTFGTPQHITLASLRVEHLFAADAHTKAVLQQHVQVAG